MPAPTCPPGRAYRPRLATETTLYRVFRDHLLAFLESTHGSDGNGPGLPRHVEAELRGLLTCGVLAAGFLRARCRSCGEGVLIPFSCGARVVCASCGTRRMESQTAHWVDHVLPNVPMRLWTLSLPFDLRRLLAADAELLTVVHRLFIRRVFRFIRHQARARGLEDARPGAVSFIQHFSASLTSAVHFHALVSEGAYTKRGAHAPLFHRLDPPSPCDLETLAQGLADQVRRHLRRRGILTREGELAPAESQDESPATALARAAAQDRISAGSLDPQGCVQPRDDRFPRLRPVLLADIEGFNIDARVAVTAADKQGRTRLCRYATRPPFADSQFTETADGRIAFALRKPRKNGTTHLFFTPQQLIRRLAWLIPSFRQHLVRYEGVLAPGSAWRSEIVPMPETKPLQPAAIEARAGATKPTCARTVRLSWAALLLRVHDADALRCPRPGCNGRLEILAAITDPGLAKKILDHLGLPSAVPTFSPARSRDPPPDDASLFDS